MALISAIHSPVTKNDPSVLIKTKDISMREVKPPLFSFFLVFVLCGGLGILKRRDGTLAIFGRSFSYTFVYRAEISRVWI